MNMMMILVYLCWDLKSKEFSQTLMKASNTTIIIKSSIWQVEAPKGNDPIIYYRLKSYLNNSFEGNLQVV